MPFTPVHTLLGGFLLHLSTSTLLSDTANVFNRSSAWQRAALGGLLIAPALGRAMGWEGVYASDALTGWGEISLDRGIVAGLLVGLGSRLGSGCTSGHFLCGVSRGSKRSLIATATFFSAALVTANLTSSTIPSLVAAYTPSHPSRDEFTTLFKIFAVLYGSRTLVRQALKLVHAPSQIQRRAPYVIAGLTFSFGLSMSGMADPRKVLSFLTIFPLEIFDPSLAMVVLSGVVPNVIHWLALEKGKTRFSWEKWSVPTRKDIDWRLFVGSAIFGIGWGLAGVCPGPALVSVGRVITGLAVGEAVKGVAQTIFAFTAAMVAGMAVGRSI
ncbi:hypothetical protein DB88DRAFT_506942 [Papiliotrema laurentii]|uniref:Sulphur transport domain-containing protein n=1 Tax=Papiliotrema laurentii TaxID=5418 RepID=A0AAD9CTR4_PAPLA|nr:hypothetical protein DB88DRAFT_506942 [Papiliotrema laurentii]